MLFFNGHFCSYVAGRLDAYDGVTIIIAMTDPAVTPIVRWLFQTLSTLTPTFAIDHEFTLTLVDATDASLDMYHYSVSCADITIPVSILGIDTNTLYGALSNIDLVHFVWDNFIRFSYKRYAIALAPQGARSLLPELFVKHYRVESDGWKDSGNCDECIDLHKELLLPFNGCIYLLSAGVRSVRVSHRPWPIVPVTSFSTSLFT